MSLRVYLAAPYGCRDNLRSLADELRSIGMTVTSSWLNEEVEMGAGTVGAASDLDDKAAKAHVRADFADIARSDVLVLFTESASRPLNASSVSHSGGRHVETGYALAKSVDVIVVGDAENIFHRALDVVPDWHAAVLALIAFEKAQPRETGNRP